MLSSYGVHLVNVVLVIIKISVLKNVCEKIRVSLIIFLIQKESLFVSYGAIELGITFKMVSHLYKQINSV